MRAHAVAELPAARTAKMFGDHLVDRGLLSQGQLEQALERQRAMKPSFGRVAYQLGLLSLDGVMEVLDAQRKRPVRFGELAVEMGLLSEADNVTIAQAQEETRLPLGQVLASMGLLDPEVLDAELRDFEAEREARGSVGASQRTD